MSWKIEELRQSAKQKAKEKGLFFTEKNKIDTDAKKVFRMIVAQKNGLCDISPLDNTEYEYLLFVVDRGVDADVVLRSRKACTTKHEVIVCENAVLKLNYEIKDDAEHSHEISLYKNAKCCVNGYVIGTGRADNSVIHKEQGAVSSVMQKGLALYGNSVAKETVIIPQNCPDSSSSLNQSWIVFKDNASVKCAPSMKVEDGSAKAHHGCIIKQIDKEGLFAVQQRGIPEKEGKEAIAISSLIPMIESWPEHYQEMLTEEIKRMTAKENK